MVMVLWCKFLAHQYVQYIYTLGPERYGSDFKSIILRLIIKNIRLGIRCEIIFMFST